MKRTLIIALALVLTLTGTALAVSRDEAGDIAARCVPEDCVLRDVDREGFSFEVKFDRPAADEEYEVTLKSVSGTLVKVEREYVGRVREGEVKLTADEAVLKMNGEYPEAAALLSILAIDDKNERYQVLFAQSDRWGLMEIGPESGLVLKSEVYFENAEGVAGANYLPFEEIKQKALSMEGGKFEEIKLEYDDGRLMYKGELDTGLFDKAEFEIDPVTGKILDWDD